MDNISASSMYARTEGTDSDVDMAYLRYERGAAVAWSRVIERNQNIDLSTMKYTVVVPKLCPQRPLVRSRM
eukprot:COSAG06_NODE_4933_length_3836_cov_2.248335_2_plen_71_part_00